jgi:hypothetical protein
MKKLIALIVFFAAFALQAQDDDDGYFDAYGGPKANPMAIGGYLTYSGGVNAAETPDGIKNRFLIANMVDIGATFYYPLAEEQKVGILAELGYTNYSYGFETDPNGVKSDYFLNYISFNPHLWFKGFRVGLNFAFPMGGTLIPDTDSDFDLEVQNDQMTSPLVDIALGAYIPVVENKSGSLNFILSVSYALTGVTDSDFLEERARNQNPATARIGLSYLFNINN